VSDVLSARIRILARKSVSASWNASLRPLSRSVTSSPKSAAATLTSLGRRSGGGGGGGRRRFVGEDDVVADKTMVGGPPAAPGLIDEALAGHGTAARQHGPVSIWEDNFMPAAYD